MLGNAMIQPMMYFNLRNVPMFSGPYMILKVTHRISESGFDTVFEGQRQPFYSIPAIDKFLQSLSTKILQTIQEKIAQNDIAVNASPENVLNKQKNIVDNVTNGNGTLTTNQNCSDKLNNTYTSYTNETPVKTSISPKDVRLLIINEINTNSGLTEPKDKTDLLSFIFCTMYVDSFKSGKFETYGYNYASVKLTENYGGSATYFTSTYFCVNQGNTQNIPLVIFDSDLDFIRFFISKFKSKVKYIAQQIPQTTPITEDMIIKALVKTYILKWTTDLPDNVYSDMTESDLKIITDKFKEGYNTLISLS